MMFFNYYNFGWYYGRVVGRGGRRLACASQVHIILKMKVLRVDFSHHVVLLLLVNYRLLNILLFILFLLSSLFFSSWSLFWRGGGVNVIFHVFCDNSLLNR